jgi:drug/metabolite transporter (DMT)-like permease
MTLLYVLLRRGSASSVASLFYLVPPVTVLMAWICFDEVPGTMTIVGCAIVGFSVYFGTRKPASTVAKPVVKTRTGTASNPLSGATSPARAVWNGRT